MEDEEILHRFYKWAEEREDKRVSSREKELIILAYKLGKGIFTIDNFDYKD